MNEPTPSQLKIDGIPRHKIDTIMTQDTHDQLKIDGIVTVPEGTNIKSFVLWFHDRFTGTYYTWNGEISPLNPDAESFMRLYRVEEVEALKKSITSWQQVVTTMTDAAEANDKAYSDLAEQLRQEKEKNQKLYKSFILLDEKCVSQDRTIGIQADTIAALELRLKVKDSPIKAGLKRIWKWFKSTVNQ